VLENLLYFLPGDRGLQFTTIAQTWTDITLHTMHAVVIFSFNTLARDILKSIIGKGQIPSIHSIMPTSFIKPTNKVTVVAHMKLTSANMYKNADK
jgi:hypothetical protein